MTKRFGFTLAEVLITLGIIGVVAAMTMPTLINATQGAQYKAAYKKALSAISQAVTLNLALEDVDFAQTSEAGTAPDEGSYSIYKILNTRMNVVKINTTGTTGYAIFDGTDQWTQTTGNNYTFFLNDGVTFSFPNTVYACTKNEDGTFNGQPGDNPDLCRGFIDVNGQKGPNKLVKCENAAWNASSTNCIVKNPTDVYPVRFYDGSVIPNTDAARAVLYGK